MPKLRKILHLISRLDGYGTTRQLRILAQGQLAEGNDVRIAALSGNPKICDAWEAEGLRLAVMERRWPIDPFAAWRLADLLRTVAPELVHAWDTDAVSYTVAARLRAGSVPLVATLLTPPSGSRATGQIDRLAVGSEALKRDYQISGVPTGQLAVVPPAVSLSPHPSIVREQLLSELNLPLDSQLIAVVGPLVRGKRFDEAIWCFELVRTLDERAALVIFGDGPDRQRLERFTRLVSEPTAVKFLGYRDDLGSLLSHVNVFWHLSEQPSISGALLEAMANRVPAIASDVPVHRELIDHGRTGFLFPVGSRAGLAKHTLRLLEDANRAREIGEAASAEVVSRFSAAAMAEAYRRLYSQLLTGSAEAA